MWYFDRSYIYIKKLRHKAKNKKHIEQGVVINAISDHNAIYISIKNKISGKQSNANPTNEKQIIDQKKFNENITDIYKKIINRKEKDNTTSIQANTEVNEKITI